MTKYGTSLSFCVRDIAKGNVKIEDVAVIFSGTRVRDDADWQEVLDHYCVYYWKFDRAKCVDIANRLRSRMIQTRVDFDDKYQVAPNQVCKTWVDPDELRFVKQNGHGKEYLLEDITV